jgi:hypothetical protein
MSPRLLEASEQQYAIKTWRYLRVAMVVLVVGLFVSIAFERWGAAAGCFEGSISAYYYTPVHDYFVAALIGIGVCLFCLRGCTDIEDGLLNLAGMFAPVVALVPTTKLAKCASVSGSLENRDANIENNIIALIVVGLLAGVILAGLTLWGRIDPPLPAWVMFALAAAVWITLMVVFVVDRDYFERKAHYAAAIPMFVCIVAVVLLNAWGYKQTKKNAVNLYWGIGGAMVGASASIGIAARFVDWDYWVIVIEAILIGLFALFWVVQTIELWDDGLRSIPEESAHRAPNAR